MKAKGKQQNGRKLAFFIAEKGLYSKTIKNSYDSIPRREKE